MDALHVLAGVLLQFAGMAVWRRGLGDLRPWFLAVTFTLLNEGYDLWAEQWPSLGMQLGEGAKDVALTLLLPSLLLILARVRPTLLVRAVGESR